MKGLDRASSSQVDSGVGDDPKSSKTYRRKRQRLRNGRLSLLRVEARETELPKPAKAGFFLTTGSRHKYLQQRLYPSDAGSNRRLTSQCLYCIINTERRP